VAAQYSGNKAALIPLYDALLTAVKSLGTDVEIAPKKNNVSILRSKQFAILHPSSSRGLEERNRPRTEGLAQTSVFAGLAASRDY
jgi:hypothetical protein